tara:strand:+ start:167 stop:292 length:126 start_codon:yes stop_codon:yes gene_type:complete
MCQKAGRKMGMIVVNWQRLYDKTSRADFEERFGDQNYNLHS